MKLSQNQLRDLISEVIGNAKAYAAPGSGDDADPNTDVLSRRQAAFVELDNVIDLVTRAKQAWEQEDFDHAASMLLAARVRLNRAHGELT